MTATRSRVVVHALALLGLLTGAAEAEEEATKTTVLKVSRLLEQRIEAFDRAFRGSRRENYITATVGLLQAIDGLEVSIDVIMLSHCDDAEAEGKISKPVDFEVLLRRLQASIAK